MSVVYVQNIQALKTTVALRSLWPIGVVIGLTVHVDDARAQAPGRDFGTYYGGEADEGADAVQALEDAVFIAGGTRSTSGISTPGTHQVDYAGEGDAYLARFDRSGQRIWGTYFGGSVFEEFADLAVDPAGAVYVLGNTASPDGIATPGAHKTELGGEDVFLAKFELDGTLAWATYYGGASFESAGGLAVDTDGNVYFCGGTLSEDGIATPDAHQPMLQDVFNEFLVKFNPDGERLWGTYFGGLGNCSSVALDLANQRVYIAGTAQSLTGFGTDGAHQETLAGSSDGHLSRFTVDGALVWSTYYGGTQGEFSRAGVSVDGTPYLVGNTLSSSGIATAGTEQSALAGAVDAFLVRFDSDGNRVWGRYFGGVGFDTASRFTFADDGSLLVVGTTDSLGLATPDAPQVDNNGNNDAFLAAFSAGGERLWSTYLGGAELDLGAGIGTDLDGGVYITGFTSSATDIATPGTHKPSSGDLPDAFLVRYGEPVGDGEAVTPEDCKKSAWQTHTRADGTLFKNQGQCLKYVTP